MKILLLGSQHGNELLGEKLHAHILQHHTDLAKHVSYMIGNPQARRRGVRYIESDLNRSYSGKKDTYEQRRALKSLRCIKQENYDLVLDLHTTTCVQPPCLITSSLHPERRRFMRGSSCKKIVHMRHSIADTSLIGVCPQAISIEVNQDETSPTLFESLCDDLRRFINGTTHNDTKQIYEVTELLAKNEVDEQVAARLENFALSPHGFYPVLVGENSYKKHAPYLGFKAYKMYESEV
jgi:hypothetical protein